MIGSFKVGAASEAQSETQAQRVIFWAGVGLLAALLALVILPTLDFGLVADDFLLVTNDHKLPLTENPDQLHRPLRNIILNTMGSRIGIWQVLPYRLLVAGSFVAILVLLFLFVRRLRANRLGALAAVFVLAFFPRNHEVLYWLAAWQDLGAAVAVLLACYCWVDFRESGRARSLVLAVIAYLIGLGLKETTIVLPAILVSIDFFREPSLSALTKRRVWQAYIPFACVLLLYVVYFFSHAGAASLSGRRSGGYYGFHGVAGVAAGVIRALLNIALPYSLPLGLKDIRLWHVAVILVESLLALVIVWRLQLWSGLILAASWLFCTILPTAAFATAFNADRYLFVPTLGVAVFVAILADALVASPNRARYAMLAGLGLALYTLFSITQLIHSREQWRNAGIEAGTVIRETASLCARVPPGSEVDVANVTHSLRRGFVLANGLSEALHVSGLPSSVKILRNFTDPGPQQQHLVGGLLGCENSLLDSSAKRRVLIEVDGHVRQVGEGCASPLIDSDRSERPLAWDVLYGGQ